MTITLISLMVISLLAGILISGLLYFKQRDYNGKSLILSLFSLRALAIALILFVVIAPFIPIKTKTQIKPVLAVLVDNSSSMLAGEDSSKTKTELFEELKNNLGQIGASELQIIPFDAELKNNSSPDFSGSATDISKAIKEVKNQISQEQLSAIVLVSDGINNRGANPLYEAENDFTPIYTIGVGDSTLQKDLSITQVNAPRYVFRGDEILIEATITATNLDGEKLTVKVKQGANTLASNQVTVDAQRFAVVQRFKISTKKPGLYAYDIIAETIAGEKNTRNNSYRIYVEVIENRQEIMVISGAPSPDVAALREGLKQVDAYEVKHQRLKSPSEISAKTALVVLFIQSGFSPDVYRNVLNQYIGPIWLVIDPLVDGRVVSASFDELSLISNRRSLELKSTYSSDFGLFKLSRETIDAIKKMPEVGTSEGILQTQTPFSLFIKGFDDRPLAAYGNWKNSKMAIFNFGGLWHWRVHDYQQYSTHRHIDEWLQATVQYLTVDGKKDRLRLIYEERQISGQQISIKAEVYDATFNLSADADVSLELKNESGSTQQFDMNLTNDVYESVLTGLTPGTYQLKATAKLGDETLTAAGEFVLEDLGLEELNTRANFTLLSQLSAATGGAFFTVDDLPEMRTALEKQSLGSPIEKISINSMPLIELFWLLFIAAALLAIEWLLRRYYGRI